MKQGATLSPPKGWEIKELGEVSEYFNGLTYSPKDVSDKGTIVLRSSNIQNDELDFSDLVRVNVNIKEKLFLKEGDILMCSRNGSQRLVGKTAPILNLQEPMTFGTFMMIIRSEISPYLLWFFKTDDFKKQISGGENTMINQVTRYMLDEIKIPLPPLPEQQRIVAILDEAFAAIAKALANAEQNLKNAKELFESYLQGVFEKKGEGWEEKMLGEVCNVIGGGTPSKSNNKFYNGDIYWATVKDMKGEIIENTEHKITKDAVKKSSTNIIPGGNVIIATRVGLGKVCIIGNDTAINQDLRGVVPINSKKLSVDFLYRWFKSIAHKIVKEGTGATVQGVKLPFIKSLVIYIPTIKIQHSIVQKLDALSAEIKKLEVLYQKKIVALEELKKSILQKAFSGEL